MVQCFLMSISLNVFTERNALSDMRFLLEITMYKIVCRYWGCAEMNVDAALIKKTLLPGEFP